MILVVDVWTFLRALLGRSTAITLENIALCHQLMVRTASSGFASHVLGNVLTSPRWAQMIPSPPRTHRHPVDEKREASP